MGTLDPSGRVAALLSDPNATVMALDPSGASIVPLPRDLACAAQVNDRADAPMGNLDSQSMGRAVSLFELARRNGASEGAVTLADGESTAMLYLVDVSADLGVFLAILVPRDCAPDAGHRGTLLTPRQITSHLEPGGIITRIDEAYTTVLGWAPAEIVGRSALEIAHPEDHEHGLVNWAELLDDPGGARRIRLRLQHRDGSWIWFETTSHNHLGNPDLDCIVSHSVDISDEMAALTALHNREALLARLTEALPTGVLHLDPDLDVLFSNARWFEITRLADGSGFDALLEALHDPLALRSAVENAIGETIDVDIDVTFHAPDGVRHGKLCLRPLVGSKAHEGLLLSLEDTTEARLLQERLVDEARRDGLTGLLNRSGIVEALNSEMGEDSPTVAALYIDLDRFKLINDEHSHSLGDDVLRVVAAKLDEIVRPEDHVGRLGGDEFLMVLSQVVRPDDAFAIALRLESEIEEISEQWAGAISVAGSVGVAIARPGESTDDLLNRADARMYERKADRRVHAITHGPDTSHKVVTR